MANINNEKKQQAQFLYMAGGKTQKEIADLVGVSERTIHSWVHQLAWDKLRLAAYQAPVTIADNLCSQLVELQNDIAKREPGKRYPTPQEAETVRKLIICLERMKKYPSLSQNMQVLETFRNYVRPFDQKAAKEIASYADKFISEKAVNGYAPYQSEYGVRTMSPVMPFYDEVAGLDADEHEQDREPCTDNKICLHPEKCRFPYCEKRQKRTITEDDYKVSPAAYVVPPQQQSIVPGIAANAVVALNNSDHVVDNTNEETGSNPAIPAIATGTENVTIDPAATGSNPAIPVIEKASGINESTAVVLFDRHEETGNNPATIPQKNSSIVLRDHNIPQAISEAERLESVKELLIRSRPQNNRDHAA